MANNNNKKGTVITVIIIVVAAIIIGAQLYIWTTMPTFDEVYGQELAVDKPDELAQRIQQLEHGRVEQLTQVMETFGFSEFEYVESRHQLTISGYHEDLKGFVYEDFMIAILDYFGFDMIDYGSNERGIYFVAEYYNF